jgi:exo-beta-1,3-glucanase (GH17 family)
MYSLRLHYSFLCLSLLLTGAMSGQQDREIVKLKWVNFGPYTNPGQSPGNTPMPESQIITLLDILQPYVEGIRTYGTGGGLDKIPQLAKERGFNVMVGMFLGPDEVSNNIEITNGIAIANAGHADYLIVGGEVLYNQFLTPAELIAYIQQVKTASPTIPVTTADVYTDLLAHPEVADACDFLFPNIYPYYARQPIECALQWLDKAYQSLLPLANGKEIIISETGWKTAGPFAGDAIPSLENALRYHRELLAWSQTTGVDVTIFAAFDEPWKMEANDDGWGLFYSDLTLKPGMDSVFAPLVNPMNTWQCSEPAPSGSDTLLLDYIPVTGSFDDIRGHINYLNTCDYSIASYIKVGSGWWTKPTFAMPTASILCNGQWVLDYTGGGNDHLATDMCFFLVPSGYAPPPCSGCSTLPPDIYTHAIADLCVQRYALNDVEASAADASICSGDSTQLTASGGTQFLWSTGETSATISIAPTATTTYSVTITDGQGGGAIATVQVSVLPKPNFTLSATPDSIETGGTTTLAVTGAGSTTFLWSTGETIKTIQVSPLATTTYTVTATSGNGCTAVDSITVVVNPITSSHVADDAATIKVYPTPVRETLYVEVELPDSKPVTISMLDALGCVVTNRRLIPAHGKLVASFELIGYPPGLYFLVLRTTEGLIHTEKIAVY